MGIPAAVETREFSAAAWWLAVGVLLVVVFVVLLPPFVGERLRTLLMAAFSGVCHQLPERSPHLHGIPLAVCHRCLGIYLGLAAAAAAFRFLPGRDGLLERSAPWWIVVALAVPGLDWLAGVAGLWSSGPFVRIATGSVFGVITGLLFTRALAMRRVRQPSTAPDVLV